MYKGADKTYSISELEKILNEVPKETRVKKFKSYRIKIHKEVIDLEKGIGNKNYFDNLEKSIKKINPNLVIDEPKLMFLDVVVKDTSDHGYLDKARSTINKIEINKLQEMILESSSYKDKFLPDPSLDKKGNLSLKWLEKDSNYLELRKMQEWNQLMDKKIDVIENDLNNKENIFINSVTQCESDDFKKDVIPELEETKTFLQNTKLKIAFYWLFGTFLVLILFIIIFIIMYVI